MNSTDILLLILIGTAVVLAVRSCIKNKKSGKCCGNCNNCSGCGK